MARIAGVNIPDQKQILYALPYVYGLGLSLSKKILEAAKIDAKKLTKDLTAEELDRVKNIVEKEYKVEGELKREILINIKRLKETGTWRGHRHQKGLPTRGQRTRCNSRTVRGNVKRTVGSGHKKAPTPK
jgi:small subunit ribosomal protein S13